MALDDEKAVRAILAKYETTIFQIVGGAWDEWRALQLGGRLQFLARSRACLVYDFIVQRAIAAFADDPTVRVLSGDETAKFVFSDTVVVRFQESEWQRFRVEYQHSSHLRFCRSRTRIAGFAERI